MHNRPVIIQSWIILLETMDALGKHVWYIFYVRDPRVL